ncbi:MAG TPA: M56 and DUF3738 domain-containing protein [Bryobacteraceae bacterium]|jgi:bla regulator protein BlaR1|nr:M56 and DUF3738 domain-containing protein [Bryobacteraceae bacterium]
MNLVADHLWQSTLFALVAGLLTLALRKNRARVRHWVWAAASFKFLIPLSMLITLGSHIEWRKAPQAAPSSISVAMVEVSRPFTAQPVGMATAPARNRLPELLLGIWGCGFIGIACSWLVRWRRVRLVVQAGSVVQLETPVKVISSPALLEPGVFGVFRPVLMLPEGIFDRLTAEQLRAVMDHELCHVRHRDNHVATIQMLVETVFWFHPLVWWIGKRMVEERERGCDEEVLRHGSEARVYAEAILNVCKLYVESPLVCMSGVSGSNLNKRIEQIMSNQTGLRLTFAGRAFLGTAAVAAVIAPIAVGMLNAPAVHAQSAQMAPAGPKFEVASIKSAAPSGHFMFGVRPLPGGRINATNVTLKMLIQRAYELQDFQISGGQGWIETARYNIEAKPDSPAGPNEWKEMLKNLLADRFQLAFHRETKQLPVYALVLAKKDGKLGPGMVASKEGGCVARDPSKPGPPDPGQPPYCDNVLGGPSQLTGTAATVDGMAQMLSVYLGCKVIDKTGLTGKYDVTLKFTLDESQLARWRMPGATPPPAPADASGPSLFTALAEQLGLKLESQKAPVEILVIDRAEKPSEN